MSANKRTDLRVASAVSEGGVSRFGRGRGPRDARTALHGQRTGASALADAPEPPGITLASAEGERPSPRLMTQARLDRCLERLARQPKRFAPCARRLGAALDSRGLDLEILDASRWRSAGRSVRVGVEQQFSADVERLRPLVREEEQRLARRLEFALLRLDGARARPARAAQERTDDAAHHASIRRRAREWQALRMEMVERNLHLALAGVGRYRRARAERNDLIQAAVAALFRAVDGFDWRRGVLFRTYAVHWLRRGFLEHLYGFTTTVRVPVYVQKSMKHVDASLQRLGDLHASDEAIARESGLREGVIRSARMAVRRTRSLDAPLGGADGARTLATDLARRDEPAPCSVELDGVSIESGVQAALGALTERERRIVVLRFGIGCERAHIYAEVAAEFGVSLERVRQILTRALSKMRTPKLRRLLEPLVP